jgi:hypothetical protein
VLIVDRDPSLHAALDKLAAGAKLVFVAGLPGTGKSLLIHQLAHLAHARGRRVHLLQWDVARPPFEAGAAGQRYPQENGVTHGVIRLAVGRWARAAIAGWKPAGNDLLIGETPFIGNRLIELARPSADEAEPVLTAHTTQFVIPVPSVALRGHLETLREQRAVTPMHDREREDAPPAVLRALWRQVVAAARDLGFSSAIEPAEPPYDPATYRRVYAHLLKHRRAEALPMETRLRTERFSGYDFDAPTNDLVPSDDEVTRFIEEVELRYPDPEMVEREIDGWYRV